MEFQTLPSTDGRRKQPKRHSTHSLESDKTIDLEMSPARRIGSSIRNGATRSIPARSKDRRFASAKQ